MAEIAPTGLRAILSSEFLAKPITWDDELEHEGDCGCLEGANFLFRLFLVEAVSWVTGYPGPLPL